MGIHVIARSISQPVRERFCKGPFAARVLAVFEHACDLVTPGGHVVALVLPQIGDGPLNIVVDGRPGDFAAVEPGMSARLEGGRLRVGGLEIILEGAEVWKPRPDWDRLRDGRDGIVTRLPLLRALCLERGPAGSFLALLGAAPAGDSPAGDVLSVGRRAAVALQAGWAGDPARLKEGARRLAGLGNGLTPAGDDFLAGAMLWAWLAHSDPRVFCRILVAAAAPRTTTLSAAFLRAAAGGECSAPWHRLLAALEEGTEDTLAASVWEVLAHGATSGADELAGFLWAGMQIHADCSCN